MLHVSVEMDPAGGGPLWEVILEMNVLAGAQGDVLCEYELKMVMLKQTVHKNPRFNAIKHLTVPQK